MTVPLNPRDVYALEQFVSLKYFGEMRDAFAECVQAADDALAVFMRHLPPDYRARHISLQPDAVWGETVLPNMRWTLAGLNEGYIRVSHGDMDALGMAGNVRTTFTGISREFVWDWMNEKDLNRFDDGWKIASKLAANINCTAMGSWLDGHLVGLRGLKMPDDWPQYQIVSTARVKTDQPVPRNGVYLPDIDGACAQYLIAGYDAWGAPIRVSPSGEAYKRIPTTWTLVERIADTGGRIDSGATSNGPAGVPHSLRCEAGQPCPKDGWWITPAGESSRRQFAQGDIMPALGGDDGRTIWQWSVDQAG